MTRTGAGGMNTALRIPVPLLIRIDAFACELQTAVPGSAVTRSEAIRILVTRALDSLNPPGPLLTPPPASGSKT